MPDFGPGRLGGEAGGVLSGRRAVMKERLERQAWRRAGDRSGVLPLSGALVGAPGLRPGAFHSTWLTSLDDQVVLGKLR